jgi:class 3 adenylate cyclase
MVETLQLGRDAMDRHAWAEATEAFGAADRDGTLPPPDLERMGTAAWWAGKPDDATEALERAFAGYAEAGQSSDAARVAMALAYQAFRRLTVPIAMGWISRAEHLLESDPQSPSNARVAVFYALAALMQNRYAEGIDLADRAIEMARTLNDADSRFMAMSFKGMALVFSGDWQTGFPLIDEAATAASSGQLDLRIASDIYCNTIAACRNVGDLKRAGQWANEGERWMRRQSVGGYPGICRVHRAELKMLRGAWAEAEQEARQACVELERFGLMDAVGYAQYAVGEVRLRIGDLDGAAVAFERAYELGHDGQPGSALLQLARGEVDQASRSIGRALAAAAGEGGLADRATRARLLPAQIDIALAARDLETAGRAVDELESIAADYQQPLFEAEALTGRGELLLGEDRPSEASPILGRSWRLWQQTDLPYESARARLHYAEAMAAEGDQATATRDLKAARGVFERLGAKLDLARVDALLGSGAPSISAAARLVRTFMFTDIVTSTDLVGLIGDEAWVELLQWHDRELRSAFADHRGDVVNSTGDGFFVAFESAADAVECGVEIQRRLVRHRRDHGFSPTVRIGLHTAEATRHMGDYRGRGVHVAARIGAAARGDEVLASSATFDAAGSVRFGLSDPRELTLKGVKEPVQVRSVTWK